MAAQKSTILLVTLGLFVLISLVSGQTYYIVIDHSSCPTETTPTGSGSLPATPTDHTSLDEDCLTLTQYAQFPVTTIDSNITLVFEPGHHTLDSRLQIQNVNNLVLRVAPTNSSLISVAMVTCTNSTGYDFSSISKVTVSSLEFSDCRENLVRWVDRLRMEDSVFQDGHGMELMNVRSATFERSSFISLTAFRETWDPRARQDVPSGGAIVAFRSDINATKCLFEGNSAINGGAIWTDSSISIHDSNFSSNTAGGCGGAIETNSGTININGSDFSNNTAGDRGGAIRTVSGSISIHSSDFRNNTAGDDGGAIRTGDGYISIYYIEFNNNKAGRWGGAIRTVHGSISIYGSGFRNNTASDDGGCIRTGSGSISIYSSDFSNNTAGNSGGAIRTASGSISMHGSDFRNNTAGDDGGVIRTNSGNINVYSTCNFTNNRANRNGSVILTNNGRIRINGSSFSNNSVAIDGGTIWTDSGSVNICDSKFSCNRAGDDGGAIWTDSGRITIQGSDFSNNIAGGIGDIIVAVIGYNIISIHGTNISGRHQTYHIVTDHNLCSPETTPTGRKTLPVTLTGNTPLDEYICLTITQYAEYTTIDSNISLIFEPGNHTLASRLQIQYVNNLILQVGPTNSSSSSVAIVKCTNSTGFGFGAISEVRVGGLEFSGCRENSVRWVEQLRMEDCRFQDGHGMELRNVRSATFERSSFISLTAFRETTWNPVVGRQDELSGGAIVAFSSDINVVECNFESNSAVDGGVIWTDSGSISINGSDFISNTAFKDGGVLFLGSASDSGCEINNSTFKHNSADSQGGAIYVQSKTFTVNGLLRITNNTAMSGGGIYVNQGELNFEGKNIIISENTATMKGGGIYATIESTIKLTGGQLEYIKNQAQKGGGIYLESDAKLQLIKSVPECSSVHYNPDCMQQSISSLRLYFTNNSATYGGALYISDDTLESTECFFQDLALHSISYSDLIIQNTFFANNSASISGASIFGGLLDRCTVSPSAQVFNKYQNTYINATSYLTQITNLNTNNLESKISSEPVRVCLCTDDQPDCDKPPVTHTFQITTQLSIIVSVIVVDQIRNPLPSSVRALSSNPGGLGEGEDLQNTSSKCTDLNYTISFPRDSEQLLLNLKDQQYNSGIANSQIIISMLFLPCTCPIGFTVDQSTCNCECDPCLSDYITGCSVRNSSVKRSNNVWIKYINKSNYDLVADQNKIQCLYLTYPHCPFDYCHPFSSPVWINLNTLNGSDVQCAFNRSGKLCGSCKDGLSLSLGSSRCMPCSNKWLALLIVFTIAGVALVAFLLVCNLTIAVGTINGLIFYANILTTNRATFFPFQSPNFFTVFIAWLNLDFGFVTCFFDGMDSYVKEWLQLAFPIYIIILVTMVIIGCEYSTRIAKVFVGTNPVATLATLILLSYAKSLRVIIAAFSSATLEYPDGSQEIVWLIDANVYFLKGKHISLFLVAFLILLVGIVYTSFLFSYQWLLRCPNRMVTLIKNARFYPFMDAYLAPYNIKHRHWTGLLLLVRAFLYIVAALNVSGDPGNNLLSIICTLVFLLILRILLPGRIYKSWPLDALELSFILNLVLFSAGTLYILEAGVGKQEALAYTSTSIAFITFLAILIYHIYAFVLSRKLGIKLDYIFLKMKLQLTKQEPIDHEIILVPNRPVTYSVVDPVPTQKTTKLEPEQTPDKNFSTKIRKSVKRLFDETRKDKIKHQKGIAYSELELIHSEFSDIAYIRDSDELGMERETELNDFIEVAD